MGGNMLLRNKKTGEVFESFKRGPIDLYFYPNEHKGGDDIERETYQSLAELNDEWEDYAPKEPLIKDEKIRKAVRAWAEANEISQAQFDRYTSGFSASDDDHDLLSMISFDGFVFMFVDGEYYTIDELCGEEKWTEKN